MEKTITLPLKEYEQLIEDANIKDLIFKGKSVFLDFSQPYHQLDQYGWRKMNRGFYVRVMNPDECIRAMERRIHDIHQENEKLNTALQAFADKKDREWSDKQVKIESKHLLKRLKITPLDILSYLISLFILWGFLQALIELSKLL